MIHSQGLDKLDELSSRRTTLLELLASSSSEWSPENIIASFTEADKPISLASKTTTDEENEMSFNPDLVQRRNLMRRQPT